MGRVVVLTGGGIKGAVAAGRYAAEHELILVHIQFGQPFGPAAVKAINVLAASFPSARFLALDLPHVSQFPRYRRSEAGRGSVRERGHPENRDKKEEGSLVGLLPVILSIGLQCAEQLGATAVVTGLSRLCDAAHLGLHASGGGLSGLREFLHAFQTAVAVVPPAGSKVRVEAPLLDVTYGQMIQLAQRFGVALEKTWTCEVGAGYPCKACDSCQARARAFAEAVLIDPLLRPASAEALRTQTR